MTMCFQALVMFMTVPVAFDVGPITFWYIAGIHDIYYNTLFIMWYNICIWANWLKTLTLEQIH